MQHCIEQKEVITLRNYLINFLFSQACKHPLYDSIKQIKIMKDDRLPQIDHTLLSINPQKQHNLKTESQYTIYHKALRDLKDIHEQITSIKTRFDTLTRRYKKPHRNFFMKNDQTQVICPMKMNNSATDMLTFKELKSRTVAELRKEITSNKKFEIVKKLEGAKRAYTVGRIKTHDLIREESFENMKKIESHRKTLFTEKQIKHDQLYKNEKRLRVFMKNLPQQKLKEKKRFFSVQTKAIYHKIQEKEGQLRKIQTECNQYEAHLKEIVRKKERKLKKIESLRKNLRTLTNVDDLSSKKYQQSPKTHRFNTTIG